MEAGKRLEEAVVRHYLAHPDYMPDELCGVQMLTSRDKEAKALPRVHVIADGVKVAEGFEGADSNEKEAALSIILCTSSDHSEPNHESLIGAIERMMDSCHLTAAINDSCVGIHVYQATQSGSVTEIEERTQATQLTYDIQFIILK